MTVRRFPLLHQFNTALLLSRLGGELGRTATLEDLDDPTLDRILPQGTEWVWMLGVWRTGDAARTVSRADPAVRRAADEALGRWTEDDITGSPFAITGTVVADRFGGEAALARLRQRLDRRGIRLMLDFIPNHTAPDHPWVSADPDLYVNGDEHAVETDAANWRRVETSKGTRVLALGRDPYFPGWSDTLQLDYAHPETQARMRRSLLDVARHCDGVRADMAMLVLPEVVRRTWQRDAADFWPEAIGALRRERPGFVMLAEVYWGLEDALLARGFDYAYDKALYDALASRDAARVRDVLSGPVERQSHLARFTENHDEARAATMFPWPVNRTASAIALLAPGLRFTHEGERDGARLHVSLHLGRGPVERADPATRTLFDRLFSILDRDVFHDGIFAPLAPEAAWPGNPSHAGFVIFEWRNASSHVLVVANHAAGQGQCRVFLDVATSGGVRLADLLGDERYERNGAEIARAGLYLDLPPFGLNAFDIT